MRDLALKIRRLRELQNYSQQYLADQIGISQRAYSKIEAGQTKLSVERLDRIAKILNCPMENIISLSAEEAYFRHIYMLRR